MKRSDPGRMRATMRAVTDTCSNRYHLITSGSHSWAHTAILFMLGSGGFLWKMDKLVHVKIKTRQILRTGEKCRSNAKLRARRGFELSKVVRFRVMCRKISFWVLFVWNVLHFCSWLCSSCQMLIWFEFFPFLRTLLSCVWLFLRK